MRRKYYIYIIRRGVGFGLLLISLWFVALTANTPTMIIEQLGANQTFYLKIMGYSLGVKEESDLSIWATFAVERWGVLQGQAIEGEEEEEQEIELLPTRPEVVEPPEELPVPEENWHDFTGSGSVNGGYLHYEGIFIANNGGVDISVEEIAAFANQTIEVEEGAQILIYHTHATESYSQVEGATYVESDPYRTTDMEHNITQVGRAMAEVFEAGGFTVIHDTTMHDYPNYNQSYSNSMASVSQILKENPNIQLVLDVHRDAIETANAEPYRLISEDQEVAQVMVVVGSNGGGYTHESWKENLAVGVQIQEGLVEYGDFARPIVVRTSRFNQHLSTNSLLIEVGGHGNTLEEAIAAGILFAQSTVKTLNGT
ncbi:MAG: stage II sporulation protein P [Eubacteriales bacterium]